MLLIFLLSCFKFFVLESRKDSTSSCKSLKRLIFSWNSSANIWKYFPTVYSKWSTFSILSAAKISNLFLRFANGLPLMELNNLFTKFIYCIFLTTEWNWISSFCCLLLRKLLQYFTHIDNTKLANMFQLGRKTKPHNKVDNDNKKMLYSSKNDTNHSSQRQVCLTSQQWRVS